MLNSQQESCKAASELNKRNHVDCGIVQPITGWNNPAGSLS